MSRSLGIVVPAFRPDIERVSTYVTALHERLDPAEIRVEIDVPADGVVAQLERLPVTVGVSPYRRGKGAAITAGFEALETDVLAFADADGSTPADSMASVVEPVVTDEADLAVGSRRHPDATIHSHQTLARRYLGDGFAFLGRLLLEVDLHDFQCGAKAISAAAWDQVRGHIYEPGFAWDIELIAMAAAVNQRIAEVPIDWEDQPGSTVSPVRTTLSMGRALFVARHRAKQLRDSRLHNAIAASREEQPALIDRDDAEM
ncbi:glycosyltransferase [Halorientalis salina]|uniref:glycosyltransferase n=1 Tax=Halorientalis salina TaxID=2932266 RepID=UPI0010ACAEB9|nr:glycosyltransferase [Halorientalis salina]